jgi:threonine/homoserine/homoserine lactone efflux protein
VDILEFAGTVILVTASGALAPGPLFFATLTHGSKTGIRSGLTFAVSHTVVEFTLIMLFALGLLTVASEPTVKTIIGFLGGSVLIAFGVYQIRNSLINPVKTKDEKATSSQHLFLIGLAFTGLNPYFILWWLTVGAHLIIISLEFAALWGVVFMYVCHVWMDYVWLTSLSFFAKKGTSILGWVGYRILLGIFGGILIYFGFIFLLPALEI